MVVQTSGLSVCLPVFLPACQKTNSSLSFLKQDRNHEINKSCERERENDDSLMISGHLPILIGVTIVNNMWTFSHFILQLCCAWGRTRPHTHTHTPTHTHTHTHKNTHTHTHTHTHKHTHTHTHTNPQFRPTSNDARFLSGRRLGFDCRPTRD